MGSYEIYSEEELIATFLQSEMEVTPLWSSRPTRFEETHSLRARQNREAPPGPRPKLSGSRDSP